jgi:hypothetical protein
MALIRPRLSSESLILTAPGMPNLPVPIQNGESGTFEVRIWNDRCAAMSSGETAREWCSDFLGAETRLVFLPPDSRRPVDQAFGAPGDQVGFADGFPFLLITESAVDALAERMGEALDVRRFRPNLVIRGAPAHAEDGWRHIRIGALGLRVVKPCSRCIITTINPDTAERDLDTLGELRLYRQKGSRVYFGQNLVHDGSGQLVVGDNVEVLD